MKMNSLVDGRCIRALYAASQAGVSVELNVRGICCLRPGVPGVSENIRVVSIVGRLLEHSRVYAFEREGDPTIYIASADLMPRNLAPDYLREGIIEQIELTIAAHSPEHPARIAMKMNSPVDGRCIRALYAASRAGVRVELNVRGICRLRPGLPGISENIRVVSIVGRLLEHSRVYAFEREGQHTVYIASADLMPRNLDHRVELAVPIESEELRAELLDTLERAFADNQNSWDLDGDGHWHRNSPGPDERPRSLQLELAERYAARAAADRPSGELEAGTLATARH